MIQFSEMIYALGFGNKFIVILFVEITLLDLRERDFSASPSLSSSLSHPITNHHQNLDINIIAYYINTVSITITTTTTSTTTTTTTTTCGASSCSSLSNAASVNCQTSPPPPTSAASAAAAAAAAAALPQSLIRDWYELKFSDLFKFINADGRYQCPRYNCLKSYKDASSLQRHIR
uniref:C2H2-type domain-containing protein n=1 Tax=Glossina palpalis gambiensis TaxID=67801 RepID=A0A1B0B088_9MUSC